MEYGYICRCIHVNNVYFVGESPLLWQMIKKPALRRALMIGCSLQMFQQIAGINTVM